MSATKAVSLALQGGGAHGAFTWGVLDRLLDEDRLEIEAVSATSAGAMNAAALKTGLVAGGSRAAAQAQLAAFWGSISRIGRLAGAPNPLLEWVRLWDPSTENLARAIEAGAALSAAGRVATILSPYDANPFNINPLRHLLEEVLDFDAVCRICTPHLFVGATSVRTGKPKVFADDQISVDAILASTCLPSLFQAVEIDDPATGRREAYWDGGYTGNPPLWPLFDGARSPDVVVVHINPLERVETPRSSREIMNRINEISFNAALLRELRAIDFVHRLIEDGHLPAGAMKDVLVHSIRDDETMLKLGAATKMTADWQLLCQLRDAGRAAADGFLRAHWGDLGERSSFDLRAMFA